MLLGVTATLNNLPTSPAVSLYSFDTAPGTSVHTEPSAEDCHLYSGVSSSSFSASAIRAFAVKVCPSIAMPETESSATIGAVAVSALSRAPAAM